MAIRGESIGGVMDKAELLRKLKDLGEDDPEMGHKLADRLLLEYINDVDVSEAFDFISKWYA